MEQEAVYLLLVNDEHAGELAEFVQALVKAGFVKLDICNSRQATLAHLQEFQGSYDLVLINLADEAEGLALVQELGRRNPRPAIILFGDNLTGRAEALKAGVYRYFNKTLDRLELESATSFIAAQAQNRAGLQNLYQEAQEQIAALQAVYEAGKIFTSADTQSANDTLNEIVRQALRVVGQAPDPQGCLSHLALLEDGKIRYVASSPPEILEALQADAANINLNDPTALIGVSGRALRDGCTQNIPYVQDDPDYVKVSANPNIRSQLSVVLEWVGGKGVLSIEDTEPNAFSAEMVAAIEKLAEQATTALRNRAIRLATQVAARAVTELTGLENLKAVLKAILEATQLTLQCDLATVHIYDPARKRFGQHDFDYRVSVGCTETHDGAAEILPESPLRRVIQLDPPYYVVYGEGQHEDMMQGRFARLEDVRSGLAILLHFGAEPVGVLFINYRASHVFSLRQIATAQQFADQAASAINTALLHERTRKREIMLAKVLAASITLNNSTSLNEIYSNITSLARSFIEDDLGDNSYFSHLAMRVGNHLHWVSTDPADKLELLQQGTADIDLENSEKSKNSISARAVLKNKAINIKDVTENPDYLCIQDNIHSQLSVPLIVNDEATGVLSIEHPERQAFTRDDQDYLGLFASQAAIAIRNTKRRVALEVLNEATEAIIKNRDKKQTLDSLAQQALRLVEAHDDAGCFCSIATLTEKTTSTGVSRKLEFLSATNETALQELQRIQTRLDLSGDIDNWEGRRTTLAARAAVTDKLINEGNVTPDTPYYYQLEGVVVRSIISVPARVNEEVVVVLNANHPERNAFGKLDKEVLQLLAKQAVVALQNTELLEQTRKSLDAVVTLNTAAKAIVQESEQDKTLKEICLQALKVIGREVGAQGAFSHIALIEKVGQLRFHYSTLSWDIITAKGETRDLTKTGPEIGIAGRVAKFGITQAISDVRGDPDYIQFNPQIRSQLSVPIRIERDGVVQILGVLTIEHPDLDAFNEDDISNMEALATQAALVIRNVQMYEAQSLLAVSNVQAGIWGHTVAANMQVIIAKVEDSYKLLSHSTTSASLREQLAFIRDLAASITEMPFESPQDIAVDVQSVFIKSFVEERVQAARSSLECTSDQLYVGKSDVPDTVRVSINLRLLREALSILIRNSFKATSRRSDRVIEVFTQLQGEHVSITVEDNGYGLQPDHVLRLFNLPIPKQAGEAGQGMGLMLVKAILKVYKGKIRHEVVEAADNTRRTRMIIVLPVEGK